MLTENNRGCISSSYNLLLRAAGKIQYKDEAKLRPSNCILPEARGWHSADVVLPDEVIIEKRSSRMTLHSVTHRLPTLLCSKFGAVASQPQVGRKHVHATHADN